MNKADKEELEKLRAQKKRRSAYSYKYNADNYYRAVCLWPVSRRAVLDEAIRQSGAGSISAYISGLIDEDIRRRGLDD